MCELCDLEALTTWYYKDENFIVCNCKTCGIPMIVSKVHSMTVKAIHLEKIFKYARELFGEEISLRCNQRKFLDHWHVHIIRKFILGGS